MPQDQPQTMTSQEVRAIFADHKLRSTRQRELIYLALCACKTHPTADDLLAMVRQQDPEVSQATIYNSLDAFVECKIATRIPSTISGGACRYDPNTHEHVHLVLENGQMMDVPMDLSQQILQAIPAQTLQEISQRTGVELSGIKVELLGH